MKIKHDWLDERNSLENNINEIQDICLVRNMTLKETKQEVLELTDKILISLDNIDYAIDYAIDDIESEYEYRIDALEERIEELEDIIDELKGGK